MKYEFDIDKNNSNVRIDLFLTNNLGKSRSQIKKCFESSNVFVNGKVIKAGYILQENDKVFIDYLEPQPLSANPEDLPLEIVYEDDDLAVVNKPQGMVTHPATSNRNGTLVNALVFHIKNLSGKNGEFRPGIVHRLDKDTSGLLLIAKNDLAHANLAKQIEEKTCKREYLAIVSGCFSEPVGEIITGIKRSDRDRKKMMCCEINQGKKAITKYETIEYYKGFSLVKFSLLTGRTHQIRVHCQKLNHSIVGDGVYGGNTKLYGHGQLLCAFSISFVHPVTNKPMSFEIPLPDYFVKVMEHLRTISLQN